MKKLFIISFEGMNYDILKEYINKGYLPHFKKLCDEGYIAEINCSRIPYEASGLVSAFSGLEDSKHGVFSYWHAKNKSYVPEVYQSSEIKDKMFWNSKDFKGHKVGIVNVFGTHPVYKVGGCLISYAMNRTLRYVYPSQLIRDFSKKGFAYVQDMGAFYRNEGKIPFLNQVNKVENMRHNICKELYNEDIDVYVINYTCIDRVCHFFMNEVQDDSIPIEDKAVYQMYQCSDAILGDILEYIEKFDGELIILSSVGFGPLKRFVEINPYLEKCGFLARSSDRQIDWEKTLAFEAVQGTHGININKQSFYSKGIVKDSDYEHIFLELVSVLKDMKNPYNNNLMFSKVISGNEFYKGHIEAPDIILEPYDWEYLPYGDAYWADTVGRHNQTGWHRNKSVWGRLGSSLNKNQLGKIQDLKDIYQEIMQTISYL